MVKLNKELEKEFIAFVNAGALVNKAVLDQRRQLVTDNKKLSQEQKNKQKVFLFSFFSYIYIL